MLIASKLKASQNKSTFTQSDFIKPADWWWWTALTLVNIGDVVSTNKAMKYECVYEANPLLPKRPSLERLIAHKMVTLYPIYHPDYNKYVVSDRDLKIATGFLAFVVYHNYKVIDKVKKYPKRCPRVGTI